MHPVLVQAAKMGRSGDVHLSHTSPGDVVFPVERRTPEIDAKLKELFALANLKRQRFTVGNRHNKKNPSTGLPEFFDADFATGGGQFDTASGIADSGVAGSVGTDNADSRLDNSQELVGDTAVTASEGVDDFGSQGNIGSDQLSGDLDQVGAADGDVQQVLEGGMGRIDQQVDNSQNDYTGMDRAMTGTGLRGNSVFDRIGDYISAKVDDAAANPISTLAGALAPRAVAAIPGVGLPIAAASSLAGLINFLGELADVDVGLPTLSGAARSAVRGINEATNATTTDDGAPLTTVTMAQSPDIDNDGGGNGAFGGDSLALPQNLGGTPAIGQTIGRPVATPVSAPSAAASAPESNFGTGIDDIVRRANLA